MLLKQSEITLSVESSKNSATLIVQKIENIFKKDISHFGKMFVLFISLLAFFKSFSITKS